jgi:hypothetical protein
MSSIWRTADLVSKYETLLGDAIVYGGAAAVGQSISHLILARDPRIPQTKEELLTRYIAGSSIVAAVLATYTLRHRGSSAGELMVIHGGVLFGCGIAVGALHLADYLRDRAAAEAMDTAYDDEDHGHVQRPRALPLSRRLGA